MGPVRFGVRQNPKVNYDPEVWADRTYNTWGTWLPLGYCHHLTVIVILMVNSHLTVMINLGVLSPPYGHSCLSWLTFGYFTLTVMMDLGVLAALTVDSHLTVMINPGVIRCDNTPRLIMISRGSQDRWQYPKVIMIVRWESTVGPYISNPS